MDRHNILPFYMSYPFPVNYGSEDAVMRDLEYLQQMYPTEAKRYQKRISSILDKMDYDGSVIYDEFPDRWSLYRMAESILRILRQEETAKIAKEKGKGEEEIPEEKWEWLFDMIQILLFYEIYKRRYERNRRSGFLKF